jgi:hypothetical protein
MSYIMITTRCNMECPHCCRSCTSEGENRPFRTFKKIIDEYVDSHVAIGGGEPTLHPRFWDMLMYAVGRCYDGVWLSTNGSIKDTALTLAKLAKKEIIGCDLSLDEAHDRTMVADEVIDAFEALPHAIRDVFHKGIDGPPIGPIAVGRALENYDPENMRKPEDECICPGPLYMPNGDVLWCGCPGAPVIGNVHKGFEIPDDFYESDECYSVYKKLKAEEAMEESNAC